MGIRVRMFYVLVNLGLDGLFDPYFPGAFRRNVGPSVVPGWTVRRSLRIYCPIFITYTQNTLFCVLGAAHAREVYVEKDRASGRNRDRSVRYTTSINLGPCIRGFGFHLNPGVMTTSLTNWATPCCPRNPLFNKNLPFVCAC